MNFVLSVSDDLVLRCRKALRLQSVELVQELISQFGIEVFIDADTEFSLLHESAEVGNVEMFRFLLCQGAQIDSWTSKGAHSIHVASVSFSFFFNDYFGGKTNFFVYSFLVSRAC